MLFLNVDEDNYNECLASVTFDEDEPIDTETIMEEINYIINYAFHNMNEYESQFKKELKDFQNLIILKHHAPETEGFSIVNEAETTNNNQYEDLKGFSVKLLDEKTQVIMKKQSELLTQTKTILDRLIGKTK